MLYCGIGAFRGVAVGRAVDRKIVDLNNVLTPFSTQLGFLDDLLVLYHSLPRARCCFFFNIIGRHDPQATHTMLAYDNDVGIP